MQFERFHKRLFLAASIAALASGCHRADAPKGPTDVQFVKVSHGLIQKPVIANGVVVPDSTVIVGSLPTVTGEITKVYADVGQKVVKGQLLAEIDPVPLQQDVATAQALAQQAKASYDLVVTPYRPEQIQEQIYLVEQDEHMLKEANAKLLLLTNGNLPDQIAQSKAALDAAETTYKTNKAEADRIDQLFSSGDVSLSTKEAADSAAETAKSQAEVARYAYKLLVVGFRPEEIAGAKEACAAAQATLDHDKEQLRIMRLGSRPEAKEVARQGWQSLIDKATQAHTTLTHTKIYSPLSGTIIGRNVAAGEVALGGTGGQDIDQSMAPIRKGMFLIADDSKFDFQASIDQSLYHDIKLGQDAKVVLDAFPGVEFRGQVLKLEPNVSPEAGVVDPRTGHSSSPLTFNAWVRLGPTSSGLVGNQTGNVRIESSESGMTVPMSAINGFAGGDGTVFVVNGDTIRLRHIRFSQAASDMAVVSQGLTEGDRVVVSDWSTLKDGQTVQAHQTTSGAMPPTAF